ncbi:MAG: hypothetical protein FJ272_21190, partial [Planctomycetes bacterium]|nr:hypothetical protein [Planctomycetota bacterium]
MAALLSAVLLLCEGHAAVHARATRVAVLVFMAATATIFLALVLLGGLASTGPFSDAFTPTGQLAGPLAASYMRRFRWLPLIISLAIFVKMAFGRAARAALSPTRPYAHTPTPSPEPTTCAWADLRTLAGPLLVATVAAPLLLGGGEALAKLAFADLHWHSVAERCLFVLLAFGVSACVGLALYAAFRALAAVSVALARAQAQRSAETAETLEHLLALVVALAILGFLAAAGYSDAKTEVVRLRFAPSLATLAAVLILTLTFPLKAAIADASRLAQAGGFGASPAAIRVWATFNAPLVVALWPFWLAARRLARSRPRLALWMLLAVTLAALLLFTLGCGYLIVFKFHHAGRFLHLILARIAIVSTALGLFSAFFCLPASWQHGVERVFAGRRHAVALAALAALGLSAFVLIDANEHVKYVALDRTEVVRAEIRSLREWLDFDRDSYSALLGGGDVDDRDVSVNPASGRFKSEIWDLRFEIPSRPKPSGSPLPRPPAPKWNLVLITVDALRADALGCYGYARPTSPKIDRLAAESVLFE